MVVPAGAGAASQAEPFDPVSSLYEKGNEYFRRGAYSSAVSVFLLVSDNHPEHVLAPEALFSIGSAKHKMGDHDGARTAYEDLMKKYPNSSAIPDAMLQLGAVLSETGNMGAARGVWTRLTQEYQGSISARIASQRLHTTEPTTSVTTLAPERPMAAVPPEKVPEKTEPIPSGKIKATRAALPEQAHSDHGEMHGAMHSAPPSPVPAPAAMPPDVYVVKKGDSLSGLAKKFLGSTSRYRELAKLNKISAPYTLTVGQTIKIPGGKAKESGVAVPASAPSAGMPSLPKSERSSVVPEFAPPKSMVGVKTTSAKTPPVPTPAPTPSWDAFPADDMEKAVDSIQQWVDDRSQGYTSLQTRLLELQQDVRGQKVLEKQLEFLKSQLDDAQNQNGNLKKELIDQSSRLKEMKDRNLTLMSQIEGLTDSAERMKAEQSRASDMDLQMKASRQKMEILEKQNQTLSETLQKMRDAFDAQMGLVKAYYDSQLTQTRQAYEARLDTSAVELARLRDETRKKDQSLSELKRDYADLMKKTANIQKEMIEEKKTKVSKEAAKQSLDRAQDFRRAGKIREAEAAYKEALSVNADNPDALNGLAYLYADENANLDEAEKLIERAMSVDPEGRGYYLDTLGWIHYVRKAFAASLDALLEAHRRIPVEDLSARAAVSFHIGKVYQATADKDKAFFHFIDAIKLAPRTRWATLSERELDTL